MNLSQIADISDSILFIYFALCVMYLFIFAFFSRFKRGDQYPPAEKFYRTLVLFPAYKEDRVIISSVHNFLTQDYPRNAYEIMVISDQMTEETNRQLSMLPIRLLKADYEDSSKAKALNFAMNHIHGETFDIVVIMDADNTVETDFLEKINRAYHAGALAIQAHRKGKNVHTEVALLDAASEEMNNAYFRKGHVFLGLSSALSGSGMAFDFTWFKENIRKISSAGEDKELEILLLKQRIYIEYLHDVPVYDEKVMNSSAFYKQRRRWMAAQVGSFKMAIRDLPHAILSRNIDYCDKLLQWMMLPRLLLLGLLSVFAPAMLLLNWDWAVKWLILLGLLIFTFALAIPGDLDNKALGKAIKKIPVLFILMFINLFRLRGAHKKFIHTSHGEN